MLFVEGFLVYGTWQFDAFEHVLFYVLVCSWTREIWNIDKLLLQRRTWNHPRYDRKETKILFPQLSWK